MGKRRRASKEKKSKRKPKNASDETERKNFDIDEECVAYHSSDGEHENQQHAETERIIDSSDSNSSSGSESDSSEARIELGEVAREESDVELSLEFFDPKDVDATAISMFLSKYVGTCVYAKKSKRSATTSRALAEAVCSQTRVGTTIRLSEDEAPIGFISVLNVREHAKILDGIRARLEKESDKDENARFKGILQKAFEGRGRFDSEKMGLILCERVVNMPPMIIPKMLEALFCEVEWATEDEPSEGERENYRFGWYLYVTEVFETDAADGKEDSGSGKKRKTSREGEEKIKYAFVRVEDAAWMKHAAASVTWDVDGEVEKGLTRKRIAMIIAASKIGAVREMVMDLVGSSLDEKVEDGDAEMGTNDGDDEVMK